MSNPELSDEWLLAVSRLLESGFHLQAVEEFSEKLNLRSSDLEDSACLMILEAIIGHFEDEITPHSKQLLHVLNQLLSYSPSFVRILNNKGPSFVKQHLRLSTFLLHENRTFAVAALDLITSMIALCPQLVDWRRYVDDTNAKVQNLLVNPLALVAPAKVLPTFEDLTERMQSSVTKKFATRRKARNLDVRQRLNSLFPESFTVDGLMEDPASQKPHEAGKPSKKAQAPLEQSLAEMEIEEEVARLTSTTSLEVSRHVTQMQDELLNNDEKVVRTTIAMTAELRQKAAKNKSPHLEQLRAKELLTAQQSLVELHLDKRKLKAKRLEERLRYLAELSSSKSSSSGVSQETLTAYHKNVALQREAIAILEKIYDTLAPAIRSLNISAELSFLDRQIGAIYDASFSFVVAGVISVGKSSFVNCLTGQDLCPNRVDTMTAIPTNYVHDPTAEVPVMVIPFADQLNQLLKRIREFITAGGKENFCQHFDKPHLVHLAEEIANGLILKPRYTGAKEILRYSTYVHDLFRIAVEPSLATELVPFLPLDWSQGLGTYLTVYVKFPRADIAAGLINLSIVDTPGINEFGVKRLNLYKTIQDALATCTHGVLIATNDSLSGMDNKELRKLFDSTKKEFLTPMASALTHSERVAESDKGSRKKQVSSILSIDADQPWLRPEEVFLVSTLWMLSGMQMMNYVTAHNEKPTHEAERKLVEDFVTGSPGEDAFEDKLQAYQEASVASIKTQCERRIKHSGMPDVITQLMDTAIRDGLKILVTNAVIKSVKMVKTFVAQLQLGEGQGFGVEQERTIQRNVEQLSGLQKELSDTLSINFARVRERIQTQGKEASKSLQGLFSSDKPLDSNPANVETFEGHLLASLAKFRDEKIRSLVFQASSPVEFKTQEEVSMAETNLTLNFKHAVLGYFWKKNRDLPMEALSWGKPQKRSIEKKLQEIAHVYASEFKIPIDRDVVRELMTPDEENVEATLHFAYRSIVRKKKKTLMNFLGKPQGSTFTYAVDPQQIRAQLLAVGQTAITETLDVVERSVELALKDAVETYIGAVSTEIKRVQELADMMKELLVTKRTEKLAPIREVTKNLVGVLTELDTFVQRCQ